MNTRDFEEFIEAMHTILKMKKNLMKEIDCDEDKESNQEPDDEPAAEPEAEPDAEEYSRLAQELSNELKSILLWSFGLEEMPEERREAKYLWKKLHPTLREPRILKLRLLDPATNSVCLFMDIIPLYYEAHKQKQKQDPLSFNFELIQFVGISDQDLKDWAVKFPHINVQVEITKAAEWVIIYTNRNERNWRKFLERWLRVNNSISENKSGCKLCDNAN
jgi:hypothetical protein